MRILIPCLVILAVENVKLVQSEHVDNPEVLDSTYFKNAVAKELLKKKLTNLEAARQQDSLVTFLRKGGKNLPGLKSAPKSNYHKDDDPSRKQSQMANTFIASSNLLFGTKSQQKKSCRPGGKQNKEGLDMQSLRQACSGYNEDGSEFLAAKEAPKVAVDAPNNSDSTAMQKRSSPNHSDDPISCYLSEPKKVTCTHKDVIYKIALPDSEVGDDDIGRIVESIYRAVEGKSGTKPSDPVAHNDKTSLTAEVTGKKVEDSSKKKRASEDYLRSMFLNNLLVANHNGLPNYNGNNPVFIPLLIPVEQQKIEPPKAPASYYSAMAIDPRLQLPVNFSAGVDPVNYQSGRNVIFDNGYGQYVLPEGFASPELNLKQRSSVNLTAEAEKRRNWLALMATNGLVPVENPRITQHSTNGELQSIAEEQDDLTSGSKLTVAETGDVLNKLLNKRQPRDTYFLRRQLRKKPVNNDKPAQYNEKGVKHVLSKVVQKLTEPDGRVWDERKCGCPCPCPTEATKCTTKCTKKPRCPIKCPVFFLPGTSCCTTKCTTPCSTCPEGCQPVPQCHCSTTRRTCYTKSEMCGDNDLLSKVVSGQNEVKDDRITQNILPPPVQTNYQHWLPYSPQFIPPTQLSYADEPHQFANQQSALPKEQDNQQYYTNVNKDQQQYFSGAYHQPYNQPYNQTYNQPYKIPEDMANNHQLNHTSNDQFDNPGQLFQENSGHFDPSGPPEQTNLSQSAMNWVKNRIQVHQKQKPAGTLTNIEIRTLDGSGDIGSKANETQNKSQIESNSSASKIKKHRDSFFARLRSKFHKGIAPNGIDQGTQSKPLGTSIFKFNQRNVSQEEQKEPTTSNSSIETHTTHTSENKGTQNNEQPTNHSLPSAVNNINITIQSMYPRQNKPPNGQNCPGSAPSTPMARAMFNTQNNKFGRVTKIWLCALPSSPTTTCSTTTTTRFTTCTTTTQCPTWSTTTPCPTWSTTTPCPTWSTTSACSTTSTCSTTTHPTTTTTTTSCPTTQSSCSDTLNPTVCTKPVDMGDNPAGLGGGLMPQGLSQYPYNPWTPSENPPQPPGTSQHPPCPGNSGSNPNSFNLAPIPSWNQWRNPEERTTAHLTENSNWLQNSQVPLPTPFTPRIPLSLATHHSKVPPQTSQRPTQNQFLYPSFSPPPPKLQEPPWPQIPQQVPGPLQQSLNRPPESDPRWPNVHPNWPPGPGTVQPLWNEYQYHQDANPRQYEANTTLPGEPPNAVRKINLPNDIKQHIARVRRYLLKKRSKTSKHPITTCL